MNKQKKFENVGKLVGELREASGLSQEALSKKLGYKNGQFISNIERGLSGLPVKKVCKLAQVLKVGTDPILKAMVADFKHEITIVTNGKGVK